MILSQTQVSCSTLEVSISGLFSHFQFVSLMRISGLHYVQDMCSGKELYRICSAITDSQVQWQKMDEPFDTVHLSFYMRYLIKAV